MHRDELAANYIQLINTDKNKGGDVEKLLESAAWQGFEQADRTGAYLVEVRRPLL